ncbi:MAG: winged helix-turn-helix domain-containing protein [Anaerolineae bacterium]
MPPEVDPEPSRRVRPARGLLTVAGVVLNVEAREVEVHGETHHLTPKECRLLKVLMENAGETRTRESLMEEVWETTYTGDMRTLEVHISWLRAKIEEDRSNPLKIQTVRKVGYRFVGPDELE